MRRIVVSGLVVLMAVLGGALVPAAATTEPTAALRPASAAMPAAVGLGQNSVPRISCVTAAHCLGIEGSSSLTTGSGSSATSIARWNGSAWKRVHVALPKGTRSADLLGVSCKGAKSCLVVGDYYTSASSSAASHPLALAYNGPSLKPTPTVPLPKSAT